MQRNRSIIKVFDVLNIKFQIPCTLLEKVKETYSQLNIKEEDKTGNLYFYGKSGTGKTIYSLGLVCNLFRNINIPIMDHSLMFINTSDLLIELKQSYKKSNQDPTFGVQIDPETEKVTTYEERVMNMCKHSDFLILDDFGSGKSTDWTNEIMYSIINYRYNNANKRMKTIITSNFDLNTLRDKTDERTTSRLSDMCKPVFFKKQYRKTQTNPQTYV